MFERFTDRARRAVILRLSSAHGITPPSTVAESRAAHPTSRQNDVPFVSIEREELIEAIGRYLRSRGTTIWGQGYNVFQEDSRTTAATWFADEMLGVVKWLEEGK